MKLLIPEAKTNKNFSLKTLFKIVIAVTDGGKTFLKCHLHVQFWRAFSLSPQKALQLKSRILMRF